MKTLIIGYGQIGKGLAKVLSDYHPSVMDKDWTTEGNFDIIHICFGYSDNFIQQVKEYQNRFKPKYTVIHSTTPPETCVQLDAIHSPVIGIHPHLEKGIRTFVKYLAGNKASEVADYFRRVGLRVYVIDEAKATELMKSLDTTKYALDIEWTKEVKRQCDLYKVPFDLWTVWTHNYNEGYQKLGYPEFTRPNLTPIMTPQGGHCTIPNLEFINSPFTEFIKEMNNEV